MEVEPTSEQPVEGQDAPWQEYVDRFPEEHHDLARDTFKEWDSNVTRRFQEASEYRKQWEPYEQAGLKEYDPEYLSQAVPWAQQMAEILQDPSQAQQWWQAYAAEQGLNAQNDEFREFEEPNVQEIVQREIMQALGPLAQQQEQFFQWQQQQQQQAAEAQAREQIDQQIGELKQKHGEFDENELEPFVSRYIEADPQNAVSLGYKDYQRFIGDVEKRLVSSKLNQGTAPESGGTPNGAADPVTDMREATRIAAERLRGLHRA